jgi:transposase
MAGITLKSEGKVGTRKGRCNYDVGFKERLAQAACEPGVSIAGLALEHGLNANMVHKWRRQYLAAMASQAQPTSAQFLPVMLAPLDAVMVDQPVRVVPTRVTKPASPRPPITAAGTIEIKFGGATVRIDGLVDASMLTAVLSHFHP